MHKNQNHFSPGGFLSCEYAIKLAADVALAVVESSVIWRAEGKGEEDIGVHFFERRNRATFGADAFDCKQKLTTVLPLSPLSYDGKILKIVWQVRVRLFLEGGQNFIADEPFVLNHDAAPCHFATDEKQ
jgi:hypothetical protein